MEIDKKEIEERTNIIRNEIWKKTTIDNMINVILLGKIAELQLRNESLEKRIKKLENKDIVYYGPSDKDY